MRDALEVDDEVNSCVSSASSRLSSESEAFETTFALEKRKATLRAKKKRAKVGSGPGPGLGPGPATLSTNRRTGADCDLPDSRVASAFAATRPSPGGGRWGPPPRRGSRSRLNTPTSAFAGPIPAVRAAVARAMAGALEREAAKAESVLLGSRKTDDEKTDDETEHRSRTAKAVAAVAALDSRAEWARRQAIGYELEGARARAAYASPEKAEHFSSRRRRAPAAAFAKAPRTSIFAASPRIQETFASRGPAARRHPEGGSGRENPAGVRKPRRVPSGSWKKPSVPRGRTPPLPKTRDAASSSDESEPDAWWTKPFGAVAAKAESFATDASATRKSLRRILSASGVSSTATCRRLDDLSVAIDRTRPRSSGARGVVRWADPKPKPPVWRAEAAGETGSAPPKRPAKEDSFGSASSGASGDSAAWWDGIGVAKALRRRASATTASAPRAPPRDSDRDPTRPRVAGPMVWSPPKPPVRVGRAAFSERAARGPPDGRGPARPRRNARNTPKRLYASPAIPSDALSRRRAPCVVFRPLAARRRGAGAPRGVGRAKAQAGGRRSSFSRASASNRTTRARRLVRDEAPAEMSSDGKPMPSERLKAFRDDDSADSAADSADDSVPGPGAYDVATAFAATRPSAASAPSFAPRARPAEIRVAKKRDNVHTSEEVPLDLSAEKRRVAAGARRAFPSVSFERAPPRVTVDASVFREALARNAEPSSGEQMARRDARREIAAYESGEARFLDPLARKLASGEIVAPPEPTRRLVEASVAKKVPRWGEKRKETSKARAFDGDGRSRGGDDDDGFSTVNNVTVRDALALALDPLAAWRAAVAPAVKRVPSFVKPRPRDETLVGRSSSDEAVLRGPTRAHGAADALALGRALGGGGALPLRYYLGRDEDYASRIASRERDEQASKAIAYETDEKGVGGAPVVASLRVAEALDALRASTPATVFGLAAERWAARARVERAAEREIAQRAEARRRSRVAGTTFVAGKAARLLDDDADAEADAKRMTPRSKPSARFRREEARSARFARARDAAARNDPASGAAWLGLEAARAAAAATRPSAPGWTMLPLEVTKPRVAAGRAVRPGDRPALDVRVSLVRAKGFLDGASSRVDMARDAGRSRGGDVASRDARVGPAAYHAEKADALVSRRAPEAVFGTAARLAPGAWGGAGDGEVVGEGDWDPEALPRASLDRATRRRRGVGVNMRKDSNPRFDAETRRLQTEARRVLATCKLEKLVGEKKESALGETFTVSEPEMRTKERSAFFDPTAATRARVPAADFASLTWRVSETAKGKVEMELLEAEIGPGRYEPRDEAKAGRRRAPNADFASAPTRFPPEPPDPDPTPNAEDRTSSTPFVPDVAAAAAAVRPRVAVGGVIPVAGRDASNAKNEKTETEASLPPSAVVNLEDALRYLRGERHASAPDFARAAGRPLGDPAGTPSDARAFADVSASAAASAGGAKGASRGARVSSFGEPPALPAKRPADWKSRDPDAFAEGDVLFLLPERAGEATRASRFDAPDFTKTLGREMVAALVPPSAALTADVDFLPEKALRARFGRLDRGTNAVDIGRGRDAGASGGRGDESALSSYADLDAGAYAPRGLDPFRRGLLTGQRTSSSPVDLARDTGRSVPASRLSPGGDALVLDAAAAADGTRPRRGVGASAFARAPRPTGDASAEERKKTLSGGDALVLHPAGHALDAISEGVSYNRAFDFGRAAGRERDPRARWGEDDVIHALRAEPPTTATLDRSLAKVHAAGVDGRTLAAARRMERRARLEARMPRRAPGEDAPTRERTDGPVR